MLTKGIKGSDLTCSEALQVTSATFDTSSSTTGKSSNETPVPKTQKYITQIPNFYLHLVL